MTILNSRGQQVSNKGRKQKKGAEQQIYFTWGFIALTSSAIRIILALILWLEQRI